MSIRYEIDYEAVEELEKKFRRIPGNIENIINSYVHREGATQTGEDISGFINVSNPWSPKPIHARRAKWWRIEKENLGFTLKPKGGAANKPGSFGYLVFPNEGRGPRNPLEQRFMERGLAKATPKIIQGLGDLIDQQLREEFE